MNLSIFFAYAGTPRERRDGCDEPIWKLSQRQCQVRSPSVGHAGWSVFHFRRLLGRTGNIWKGIVYGLLYIDKMWVVPKQKITASTGNLDHAESLHAAELSPCFSQPFDALCNIPSMILLFYQIEVLVVK
jgi:hypothetical protein